MFGLRARGRRRVLVALSLVLFGVFTQFGIGAQAQRQANEWTGTWSSDWGTMTLAQSGASVTGNYTHDSGHITGTASGLTLTGRWDEAPTRSGPRDAGSFRWTMNPDLRTFSGTWTYDGGGGGGWVGTRTSAPPTTTSPTPTTLVGTAYALLKKFLTQYDTDGFSKPTDLGAMGIYRSTLSGLTIKIDPTLTAVAKYDPDSKSITFSRDPRTIKPDDLAAGETVWHELTHAIEDRHGDFDAPDANSKLYAERNIEYMTHVVRSALPLLERIERQAKDGAPVANLRQTWNAYLKAMAAGNRLPETRKYPPDLKLLSTWFGFKADPAAIRKFYLSGKALPGTPGANLRKALLSP